MGPAFKTFLKTLLGAVGTAIAVYLAGPDNYEVFGSLAAVFLGIGTLLGDLLERLLKKWFPPTPPPATV